jgi:Flp pilus assembly protein TadG
MCNAIKLFFFGLPVRHTSSQRRRTERGASLVEYAFVIILFFTLIFGISGFGHALYVYHHINNAAKEATRYAAVRGSTCNVTPASEPSCTTANSASGIAGPTTIADVEAYVASITPPSIDSTQFVYNICGVSDGTACPASTASGPQVCNAAVGVLPATANYPGCTVSVQIGYVYPFIFPLLPSITTKTAPCTTNGLCLSSESQMIIVH